jgi:hypothetical protein
MTSARVETLNSTPGSAIGLARSDRESPPTAQERRKRPDVRAKMLVKGRNTLDGTNARRYIMRKR